MANKVARFNLQQSKYRKQVQLRDFYNLMLLLGGSFLDDNGLPSQSLIALSKYFGFASARDLSALAAEWNKKFFVRNSLTNKPIERWDLQRYGIGQEWELHKHKILPLLKDLGLLAPRFPHYGKYETCIIHGASLEDIDLRLKFIAQFWQQGGRFNKIVVLTGERELTADETEKIPDQDISTEIAFMQYLWQNNNIVPSEVLQLPIFWVNTPNFKDSDGSERRGTTEDTINTWLNSSSMTRFNWGNCLAIANAPLILRQHVVFERILYRRSINFSVETVGLSEAQEGSQWMIYYLREIAALLWELHHFESLYTAKSLAI